LPREEFRQLKLILHSELRRRATSRRALPCPSSYCLFRTSSTNATVKELLKIGLHEIKVEPFFHNFLFTIDDRRK